MKNNMLILCLLFVGSMNAMGSGEPGALSMEHDPDVVVSESTMRHRNSITLSPEQQDMLADIEKKIRDNGTLRQEIEQQRCNNRLERCGIISSISCLFGAGLMFFVRRAQRVCQ